MVNPSETTRFLRTLSENPNTPIVFQTFSDSPKAKEAIAEKARRTGRKPYDPLARVLIGSWSEQKDTLTALSNQGAGIFVQVNYGLARGKKAITRIRALFLDLDTPD